MRLFSKKWRAPLGGCDCYLLALEDLMRRAGQGRHVGVTFVEVGSGFSVERLRRAVEMFALNQPILAGRIFRRWPWSVPEWGPGSPAEVRVVEHSSDVDPERLAVERLTGRWKGRLHFDVVPRPDGAVVMMSWCHLLFDARGLELALAEIARLAADPDGRAENNSWAEPFAVANSSLPAKIREVQPFLDRYWELRKSRVVSLGGSPPARGPALFQVVHFSKEETSAMKRRAEEFTGGIFALPYFLAVAMRAHASVLLARGVSEGALECAVSVQGRKRGSRGPIFQNQVTQLFFALPVAEVSIFPDAVDSLHQQFAAMTRAKCDRAFVVMIDGMRRLPPFLYRRFLRKTASGQLASFYHAHTGEFLGGIEGFCGGEILDGWHVPAVSQPPGTGLFFSERNGRLTVTFCWREGSVNGHERERILASVRSDLIGDD
jgi:hypothetical protein